MLAKLRSFTQRGDTIIEVMVVLAVLGLSISISYATASRSLKNTRQAQETAEASALAQSQVEALRTMTTPGYTGGDIFQAAAYCVDTTVSPYVKKVLPNAACTVGTIGYNIQIDFTSLISLPAKGGAFKVTITWPDVSGQGNDTVTSVYRLYQ